MQDGWVIRLKAALSVRIHCTNLAQAGRSARTALALNIHHQVLEYQGPAVIKLLYDVALCMLVAKNYLAYRTLCDFRALHLQK